MPRMFSMFWNTNNFLKSHILLTVLMFWYFHQWERLLAYILLQEIENVTQYDIVAIRILNINIFDACKINIYVKLVLLP